MTGVVYPGLDVGNLKYLVVMPVLDAMGLAGVAAANLVTGTALAESGGTYLRQRGGGPALGLWQMEPATHDDCWANFLNARRGTRMYEAVRASLAGDAAWCEQLVANLRYGCAMARVKYYRAPERLPAADDAAGLALYHKRWYNSVLGAADPVRNEVHFRRAISA